MENNPFLFHQDAHGLVRFSINEQEVLLTPDQAFELQFAMAEFLAKIELKEINALGQNERPAELSSLKETKAVLECLAGWTTRKYDA